MSRLAYPTIREPAAFGRVAVLLGGASAEREISLLTGNAVCDALRRQRVDAHPVDPAAGGLAELAAGRYDRAWVALHGRGGEDGTIQGLLSLLGVPFTGSGVMGSAISMDKLRTKHLLRGAGLPTPAFRVLEGGEDPEAVVAELGLPLVVKPAAEGSSLGMTKVESAGALAAAHALAAGFDSAVIAESWVSGPEYTAAVLHDRVLPLIRIEARGLYDYHAKYFSEETRYFCPCGLPVRQEQAYAAVALAAFEAVGASGWGRVDFMADAGGAAQILEVNTVPGMTSHSLVPMAAKAAGIDFDALVWRILETSCTNLGQHAVEARHVSQA